MSSPIDAFTGIVHPEVRDYVRQLTDEQDPLLDALEARALERGFPLVGRASGRVMRLLTASIGGRRVYEMGSGFGFSAWFFAMAVGPEGRVYGSERDPWELEAHAELYRDHPLRGRVELRQGDAIELLADLEGSFDVIFLDLDKARYPLALEAAVPRLRPGGLLLADNVLWGGKTARPAAPEDGATAALQRYNALAAADPRLLTTILPVGDGLSVSLRLG